MKKHENLRLDFTLIGILMSIEKIEFELNSKNLLVIHAFKWLKWIDIIPLLKIRCRLDSVVVVVPLWVEFIKNKWSAWEVAAKAVIFLYTRYAFL